MQLAKMVPVARECERRQEQRRRGTPRLVLPSHTIFDREERLVFKELERRKTLRRDVDVRRVVAKAV